MIVCYSYVINQILHKEYITLRPRDKFFGSLVGSSFTIEGQHFEPICAWKIKNNKA